MQKKIWIAVTHWRRKRLLLLQHCSNTFHCENDAFMWAPNQVTSHAVTLPQERHNRFKWQALKPALAVINFKNPFTLTPCCQSINETNMFLLLYCGFWILFFSFFFNHVNVKISACYRQCEAFGHSSNFLCRWRNQLVINWKEGENNKRQTPGAGEFGQIIINQSVSELHAIGINGIHRPYMSWVCDILFRNWY